MKKSTKVIFTKTKKIFKMEDIDIDKTLVSKKISFEKKKFFTLDILMMRVLDHYV